MRHILMKATKGSLGTADLSPLSPFHEDDVIDAIKLGKMGGIDIFSEHEKPISIDEIKVHPAFKVKNHEWVPYDESKLPIKRYYNWLYLHVGRANRHCYFRLSDTSLSQMR